VLLNNFSMAIELKIMKVAAEKYRSTDIGWQLRGVRESARPVGAALTEPVQLSPLSNAQSQRHGRALRRCSSSSLRRRSTFPSLHNLRIRPSLGLQQGTPVKPAWPKSAPGIPHNSSPNPPPRPG
jgi:hypothetical protein